MGNEAVFGIVRDAGHADAVRTDLQRAGFRLTDISLLFASREVGGAERSSLGVAPTAFEGTGATVGAVLGLFAATVAIAITTVGPLLAAGPLIATLGSAAIGAAAGALVGRRMPEPTEAGVSPSADMILSVYTETPSQVDAVKRILRDHAAVDVPRAAARME